MQAAAWGSPTSKTKRNMDERVGGTTSREYHELESNSMREASTTLQAVQSIAWGQGGRGVSGINKVLDLMNGNGLPGGDTRKKKNGLDIITHAAKESGWG